MNLPDLENTLFTTLQDGNQSQVLVKPSGVTRETAT